MRASAIVAAASFTRPRFRGVSHRIAFFLALPLAVLLSFEVETTAGRIAAIAFGTSAAAMFGASALYHGVTWPDDKRRWLRRLDHAGIYALIAGTYTAVGLLVLDGAWRAAVLGIVWAGAAVAIALEFLWDMAQVAFRGDRNLTRLGRGGRVPQIVDGVGIAGAALLLAGGIAYTAGALVYALRPPIGRRVRVSRGLPRARDRGGRVPVLDDRLLRPAPPLGHGHDAGSPGAPGASITTSSPALAPISARPTGESGETPPTLEISTCMVAPSSSSTSTVDPTETTPLVAAVSSTTTDGRAGRAGCVIRRSSRPCSFLAAWYSKFSERSPKPRAVAIASTIAARFGPSSSASSASSCSFWASVNGSDLSLGIAPGYRCYCVSTIGNPADR